MHCAKILAEFSLLSWLMFVEMACKMIVSYFREQFTKVRE